VFVSVLMRAMLVGQISLSPYPGVVTVVWLLYIFYVFFMFACDCSSGCMSLMFSLCCCSV